MRFDAEFDILNGRFEISEEVAWNILSTQWTIFRHNGQFSPEDLDFFGITDIRTIESSKGDLGGVEIEIHFVKENYKLILLGATHVGNSPWSLREHILGTIEVKPVSPNISSLVDIHIVCQWWVVYLLFDSIAQGVRNYVNHQVIEDARNEIVSFKGNVERQTHRLIYNNGNPNEAIGQGLLQAFLQGRSYQEVPVGGGRSDILVFYKGGRFLYETKIWRGKEYYEQGLREIGKYIQGENDDGQLKGVFYVIFDPTKNRKAHQFFGSDLVQEIVAEKLVHVVVININPEPPSKSTR